MLMFVNILHKLNNKEDPYLKLTIVSTELVVSGRGAVTLTGSGL